MNHFSNFRLSVGVATLKSTAWQEIATNYWYDPNTNPMVVFAQPVYVQGQQAIIQIRNVGARSFEARAVSPGGGEVEVSCSWFALPVGVWDFSGRRIEVKKVVSTVVDTAKKFEGQLLSTFGSFTDPIVVGQVQTANDPGARWSQFWCSGADVSQPPSPGNITVGRHVGEDPVFNRPAETLGVLVADAGTTEINGVLFNAGKTPPQVSGYGTVYPQNLGGVAPQIVVASQAGVVGNDGAWPVVAAADATEVSGTSVNLFMDEDTFSDPERTHAPEVVNYIAIDGAKEGARFLAQAAWGGSAEDAAEVFRTGYQEWFEQQLAAPVSTTEEYHDEVIALQLAEVGPNTGLSSEEQLAVFQQYPLPIAFTNASSPRTGNFTIPWIRNIVYNSDQLRQRVAFILSQIMVISGRSGLAGVGASVGSYYDGLAEHALGNFRDAIGHVTFHPAMAFYLSSLGNEQASADGTRQPDENYARELMQLFTIGLWELNADGTQKLDQSGEPIPTYNNDDVTNLARVFTGFWYQGRGFGANHWVRLNQGESPRRPLQMFEGRHDRGAKTLFAGKPWQVDLPAQVDGVPDINAALDGIFNHPNVGPFLAKAIIQFMVMSNPSPEYVGRVAGRFNDNGSGVRGDMAAVIHQVLFDVEARGLWYTQSPAAGKVQEPMIRLTQMIKGFRAGLFDNDSDYQPLDRDDMYWWRGGREMNLIGQWPMFSPSVFNFFQPGNPLGGKFRDQDLVAPELQVINPVTAATFGNELQRMIDEAIQLRRAEVTPRFTFNLEELKRGPVDRDELIDRLDVTLCRGMMSDATRLVIEEKIVNLSPNADEQVRAAVWIAAMSPEAAILL